MPPGVAMTIMAGSDSNYSPNDRDDISLLETLENIRSWLDSNGYTCPRPTTPEGEDLFSKHTPEQKQYFKLKLEEFIESANHAIAHENQKDACLKWKKHLGRRFPCSLAKDEVEGSEKFSNPAIISSDNSRSA